MAWGRWWAVQIERNIGPVNLGVHGELRRRPLNDGRCYGPYLDVHLPFSVLSVGNNPIWAGELDLIRSYARGGRNADDAPGR